MKSFFNIFRLRRDERLPALVALVVIVALNALVICKYFDVFSVYRQGTWGPFPSKFHVSGFDALIYTMISNWTTFFTIVFRHPLLAFLLYPLYWINQGLFQLTGLNCVQLVWAVPATFCGLYSFVFLYRILRHVVRVSRADALLLSALMLSFGYVMLTLCTPDHFVLSLFLLLLTLCIAGCSMLTGRKLPTGTTALLFVLTAGVTLSNGVKVWIAQLFANRRSFFSPRNLVLGVLVPLLLMWATCQLEYRYIARPGEIARAEAKAKKNHGRPMAKKKPAKKDGKPMAEGTFMAWSDVSTPRLQSVVDNLFGETLQLHSSYLLQDVHGRRPVFVSYRSPLQYAAEALVALLFAAGIWCGRRSRFLWLCLSFFGFDVFIHLGLGFGLNEVYIMAAHWVFVIPIAIGFLFKASPMRLPRLLTGLLALYLFIYNGWLIADYML